MKQRHGSTLLEVVIAIPISFALLLGAIGLAHKAMVVFNFAKNQSLARRTIGNLSQQFRTDVHESATAQLQMDERKDRFRLLLGHPNHNMVIYESGDSFIRRIEDRVDRRMDEDVHQEQFLIPGNRNAKVEIAEVSGRPNSIPKQRIRLTIMRQSTTNVATGSTQVAADDATNQWVDAEIEATLGVYAWARPKKGSHE